MDFSEDIRVYFDFSKKRVCMVLKIVFQKKSVTQVVNTDNSKLKRFKPLAFKFSTFSRECG